VDHAQIGSVTGCARIAAELFPKINNQPDSGRRKRRQEETACPDHHKLQGSLCRCYQNAAGSVVLGRGTVKKVCGA